MQVVRVSCVPEVGYLPVWGDEERIVMRLFQYDDPNIGVPPIKNENLQRSPYRHPTLQRNVSNDGLNNAPSATFLGDDSESLVGVSSSSLDTIRPPAKHENRQLLPYSSSSTLQSNGSLCNASFMTSVSHNSSIEVPNYIAEAPRVQSFFNELEEEFPNTSPAHPRLQAPPVRPPRETSRHGSSSEVRVLTPSHWCIFIYIHDFKHFHVLP